MTVMTLLWVFVALMGHFFSLRPMKLFSKYTHSLINTANRISVAI